MLFGLKGFRESVEDAEHFLEAGFEVIWLASFPRSGNTFFRIVLDQVYGIPSGHLRPPEMREEGWEKDLDYLVVKTHLRPKDLSPSDTDIPAVYIVRDGRDAIVSISHHRSDIVVPGSDYLQNMEEAIRAQQGSFFGGWSRNVEDWLKRSTIVIRFEELIHNPIESVQKLNSLLDLPEPKAERLPTFDDLKTKPMRYGRQSDADWRKKFFRRGKVGAGKDEMPELMQQLFWDLHGETMEKLGYTEGRWERPGTRRRWYHRLFTSTE